MSPRHSNSEIGGLRGNPRVQWKKQRWMGLKRLIMHESVI
jgi:hypothetical protein